MIVVYRQYITATVTLPRFGMNGSRNHEVNCLYLKSIRRYLAGFRQDLTQSLMGLSYRKSIYLAIVYCFSNFKMIIDLDILTQSCPKSCQV